MTLLSFLIDPFSVMTVQHMVKQSRRAVIVTFVLNFVTQQQQFVWSQEQRKHWKMCMSSEI